MDDDVGTAGLNSEGVVLVVEHVPVETQAKFHIFSPNQLNSTAQQSGSCRLFLRLLSENGYCVAAGSGYRAGIALASRDMRTVIYTLLTEGENGL
jgi:hypothetical protein